jgi:hypothetical protein
MASDAASNHTELTLAKVDGLQVTSKHLSSTTASTNDPMSVEESKWSVASYALKTI